MDFFYPVKLFADWLCFKVFLLSPQSLLAETLQFFIYDIIKIFILLATILFSVSVLRTFLPPEKIKKILSHKNAYVGNIMAALFGIVTPFCTCSAIPLFLGFIQAGVPVGVTFSFLVSSPMINEVALILLLGMFGVKVALLYAASGLVIAILAGLVIGNLKVDDLIEQTDIKLPSSTALTNFTMTWKERITLSRNYAASIIKGIWPYIVIGVGLGAWIHGYVPANFLAKYASGDRWYAVPLATLIGIPLYGSCAGAIPLVSPLIEKGLNMGTVLAFMMAVTGLSLPEFLILRKVMKIKLLAIFGGIVGLGIIFTGYLFNFILK